MAKFRLRVVEVDAEPYRPGLEDEWAHLWRDGVLLGRYPNSGDADLCPNKRSPGFYGVTVPVVITPKGRVWVSPGDWIVKNDRGERTVLKPNDFKSTYEAAEPGCEQAPSSRL